MGHRGQDVGSEDFLTAHVEDVVLARISNERGRYRGLPEDGLLFLYLCEDLRIHGYTVNETLAAVERLVAAGKIVSVGLNTYARSRSAASRYGGGDR